MEAAMLNRIILAVLAGVIAFLVCIFVGGVVLVALGVPIAVAVGKFLEQYATVISAVVALWYYFSGGSISFGKPSA
jgi:putative Mn2+ efflux pump MntP